MSGQINTLTLKCKSCGASLEQIPDMGYFTCDYCGTKQHLETYIGSDRIVAELTLRRLRDALEAIGTEEEAVQKKTDKTGDYVFNIVTGIGLFISLIFYIKDNEGAGTLMFIGTTILSAIIFFSYDAKIAPQRQVALDELKEQRTTLEQQIKEQSEILNASISNKDDG